MGNVCCNGRKTTLSDSSWLSVHIESLSRPIRSSNEFYNNVCSTPGISSPELSNILDTPFNEEKEESLSILENMGDISGKGSPGLSTPLQVRVSSLDSTNIGGEDRVQIANLLSDRARDEKVEFLVSLLLKVDSGWEEVLSVTTEHALFFLNRKNPIEVIVKLDLEDIYLISADFSNSSFILHKENSDLFLLTDHTYEMVLAIENEYNKKCAAFVPVIPANDLPKRFNTLSESYKSYFMFEEVRRIYYFLVLSKKIKERVVFFKKTQRYTHSEGHHSCRVLLTDLNIYVLDLKFQFLQEVNYADIASVTVVENAEIEMILIKFCDQNSSLWNLNEQFLKRLAVLYHHKCKKQLTVKKISQIEMKQIISNNFIRINPRTNHKRISSI